MNVVVLLRVVPDIVEELEITPDRTAPQLEGARFILSESDNHALEQALIFKESRGLTVTALGIQSPDMEENLATALAKGADRAILIAHEPKPLTARRMASVFARVIQSDPDLRAAGMVLTGVRTIADLDAPLAPILAFRLGLPHLGVVCRMSLDPSGRAVTALKEFPDGVRGEFEVPLPAVLGIQAAEKPPRYVQVSRIREATRSGRLERATCPALDEAAAPAFRVLEVRKPRVSVRAEMLFGTPVELAGKLRDVLVEHNLVPGA